MKRNTFLILTALLLTLFNACKKDNSDVTTVTDGGVNPNVTSVNCDDLHLTISSSLNPLPGVSTISGVATGGEAPYTYLWANGATTSTIDVSTNGQYTVIATDANQCTVEASINVVIPTDPCSGLSVTIQEVSNHTLNAAVTGGTAPYTYAWSTGAHTVSTSTNPVQNIYSVTITDANGCTTAAQFDINNTLCSSLGVQIVQNGQNLGAYLTGGTMPYTYHWSTGSANPIIGTFPDQYTYAVTITDANGCVVQDSYTIVPALCTNMVTYIESQPSGALAAITSGGTLPYVYLWSTGSNNSSVIPTPGINVYSVTVTDAHGCSNTLAYDTSNPCSSLNGLFNWDAVGSHLLISPVGGTPPYAYTWSTGANTAVITATTGQVYSVTITDATGCTVTKIIVL